jgi:hypothetical protein
MLISRRESADFPTAVSKYEAEARLTASLGSWPRSKVGGWVSEERAVLVVLSLFRSGYVFDGRWTVGGDGAHLVGEFRPARYSWLFYPLAIGVLTLTDFAVPAPRTSEVYAWAAVIFQRLVWVAGLICLIALGGNWLWKTLVQADMQVIRKHMQATFPRADV